VPLPPIETFQLANGLTVFVIQSDRLPVVSMQLAIRAGRMHEPRARLGVAELTADMMVKGTRRRDAAALAKAIDFVGGTIAVDATFEATLMSCSVLRRDLGTCLELLPELITQPAFPEPELARVRDQTIGKLRNRLDDASALASQHVQNLLWGDDHVRGWVTSEGTVAAIQRADVVAWHRSWYLPNNAMLVVAGDVSPRRIRADLERAFAPWRRGAVPPTPSYKEPALSGSLIRLVDKPGQTQTHIRLAQLGIRHDDPRFFDALVWNHALGGGTFGSRLLRVLRVEGGKAYGASSSFDRNLDRGSFVMATFTRNAEAVASAKVLHRELEKMAKEGPSPEEVASAVAHIAGGYGLRFQAAADVGAALIGAELHGFGREYLANFPIVVGKVDVASARRAAAEILDPRAYVLVLVGDAKDLEPQLRQAGWRYEKVAFNEVISPPLAEPEAPVDPKLAAAARAILEEAIAAKGGRAKLAALSAFRMVAAGTTTIGSATVPVEIERLFVVPDKLRIDATLDGRVKVVVAVSGRQGWQVAPDAAGQKLAISDFGPADVAQVDFERWREPELILLKALEPAARAVAAPDVALGGAPHAVVKLRGPFAGLELSVFIDRKTKLVTQMTYAEGSVAQTDRFEDYREVSGIQIAHRRHSTGGRETKLDLRRVELAATWDAKLFTRPASPEAALVPTPATAPAPASPGAAPAPGRSPPAGAASPGPRRPAPAATPSSSAPAATPTRSAPAATPSSPTPAATPERPARP
jgi:zinc protease